MGVVHAHGWVIIDCRIPQESVIRIVSTMGTKESISYKMISHGSWYRQIDKERGKATAEWREEERGKATAKSREKMREALQEKDKEGGKKEEAKKHRRVEVSKREEKQGKTRWKVSVWKRGGGRRGGEEDKKIKGANTVRGDSQEKARQVILAANAYGLRDGMGEMGQRYTGRGRREGGREREGESSSAWTD